jgi:hypothetical protein
MLLLVIRSQKRHTAKKPFCIVTVDHRIEILRAADTHKALGFAFALRMTIARWWSICDLLCHPERSEGSV